MKKSIAIILSAAMAVSAMPQAAFASTKNYVSRVSNVKVDDEFNTSIILDEFKGTVSKPEKQIIKLTLTNAEFLDSQAGGSVIDYESNLNTAKKNVTNAEQALAAAQHVKTTADSDVAMAQTVYDRVVATEDAYNSAKKEYDSAKSAYDSAKTVYEERVTAYNAKEEALKAAKDALTNIAADATEEDKTKAEEAVKAATAERDSAKTAMDTAKSAQDSQKKILDAAENNYAPMKNAKETLDAAKAVQTKVANDVATAQNDLDAANAALSGLNANSGVAYTKLSDTQYMAEFYANEGSSVMLNLKCKAKEEGDALVTIEDVDSVVSSQSLKIANVVGGSTTSTISDKTSITETGVEINNVVVNETTAGTLENGTLKLRLTNGFQFRSDKKPSVVVFPTKGNNDLEVTFDKFDNDYQDALFKVSGSSSTASTVSFGNLWVLYDEKDTNVGNECSITVSGAGTNRESIKIGEASDYGVNFTTKKNSELPVFYSGAYDDDTDTVKMKIKEDITNSWLENRKTKITFPEGVEPISVDIKSKKNCDVDESNFKFDENDVTISGVKRKGSGKIEMEFTFTLSVSPEFRGDITAVLSGSAVGDEKEITVGEARFPLSVKADVNELPIDYRNTKASDIVITEDEAGVLKKGKTVYMAIDGIKFDGTPTVEVEDGDLKIENVKVKDDKIQFDIKTESQRKAGKIRISNIELYMDRSLPSGKYDLMFVAKNEATNKNGKFTPSNDAVIRNYGDENEQGVFDVDELTVVKGYVNIVTAGRDRDDSTFTTKVSVTIGANKMTAGTKEIALDVPAYISNGYTMLPIRAITEALSDSAIVRWDDATKTVTIAFGQRIVNMTVGSKMMVINGVNVAMQSKCEITDSRAFIPLRDLGYALGLNDSQISWNDATKTATLN